MGAAVLAHRHLRAQGGPGLAHRRVGIGIGRVQFEGQLELDQRLLVLAAPRQATALGQVLGRGAQLRALEDERDLLVVGVGYLRLRVGDDGLIEVLALLGELADLVGVRRRGARGQRAGQHQPDGQPGGGPGHAAITPA